MFSKKFRGRFGVRGRIRKYVISGSVRITVVLFTIVVLGSLSTHQSYIMNRTSDDRDMIWSSNALLNVGTGLLSSIPTYILFELIINRQQRNQTDKSRYKQKQRSKYLEKLRNANSENKQEIINYMREEDLFSGIDVDLQEIDLSHLDLSEINFEGADLRGSKLTGSRVCSCYFFKTQLSDAYLDGSDLSHAIFEGAYMRNTNLQKSTIISAKFTGAFIGEAQFEGADLTSCDFRGAKFSAVRGAVGEPKFDIHTTLPNRKKWSSEIQSFEAYVRDEL